jgi:transposase, IS5 family
MIVDRFEPVNLCELIPELRLEMEPELAALDRLLDDDELFLRIKADLSKPHPNSSRLGRRSTPVEVILRMLVVRRLYDWSFEATERNVSDSLVLRHFCRLYLQSAPDDTTLIRWANLIDPRTLERLNERTVALAFERKVTRGRKLRTDGTVVETNISHPTDSSLLNDGVRVLGRLMGKAKEVLWREPERNSVTAPGAPSGSPGG